MINKNSVRKIREELGYSQGQLAKVTGVAQGTISRYETGAEPCGYTYVRQLAEGTGIDLVISVNRNGTAEVSIPYM